MSSSIYWRPALKMDGEFVGKGVLKEMLYVKFGMPAILTTEDLNYLYGFRDAGTYFAEIKILINAIEQYKKIEIFLEN